MRIFLIGFSEILLAVILATHPFLKSILGLAYKISPYSQAGQDLFDLELFGKKGTYIDIGAGVVDIDYRGIIKVVMFNHDSDDYHVNVGDRIAQLIFERAFIPNELKVVSNLESTDRESSCFRSTGK